MTVPYSRVMPIYRLGELVPRIHPEAFIHPEAVLIGDVTIGSESTVWPGAVLRGDYGQIVIGDRSSVQDGTVIHAGPGFPTVVGDGCVIGHLAHLEGCTMEDESLVGSGSVVLHWAVVGCQLPVVQFLLKRGASLEELNARGSRARRCRP